jgi:hypothetical protein
METNDPTVNMIIGALLLFILQVAYRAIKNRNVYHTVTLEVGTAYLEIDHNSPELYTHKVTIKPDKALYYPVSLGNFTIIIPFPNECMEYVFELQRTQCPISMQELASMYGKEALVVNDVCIERLMPALTELAHRMFEENTLLYVFDDLPSQFRIVHVNKVPISK